MFIKVAMLAAMATLGSPEIPEVSAPPVQEVGHGSWYGAGNWHGSHTASGEPFKPDDEITCAHRTIPLQTVVLVERGDQRVWCRINDRGPYMVRPEDGGKRQFFGTSLKKGYRWDGILDMSTKAARQINLIDTGVATVKVRYHVLPGERRKGHRHLAQRP